MCIYIYIYTYTYINIYIYIYTHIYNSVVYVIINIVYCFHRGLTFCMFMVWFNCFTTNAYNTCMLKEHSTED